MEQRYQVRVRYRFCCGYCGVSEVDVGGELTIDHFHPVSQGGSDDSDNLVYACSRCNTYKGAYWSSPMDVSEGFRLLHLLRDVQSLHYEEELSSGRLIPRTITGRFHITTLLLNRSELVEHRLRKQQDALKTSENEFLRSALADEVRLSQIQSEMIEYLLREEKRTKRRRGRKRD